MSLISDAIRDVERNRLEGRPKAMAVGSAVVQTALCAAPEAAFFEAILPIECQPGSKQRVLASDYGDGQGLERFRMLRHRLHQLRQTRALTTLLITSAVPQEGKTLIAMNLALVLAGQSRRVLLVDADLRTSAMHRALGVPRQAGFAEVLEGREELTSVLRYIEQLKIFYLPAGFHGENPTELLQGARPKAVLDKLMAAFEWVVIDSPPVTIFADPVSLASICHGTLLVVRSGFTRKESLKEAMSALEGVPLQGIILNGRDNPRDAGYYADYRRHTSDDSAAEPTDEDESR